MFYLFQQKLDLIESQVLKVKILLCYGLHSLSYLDVLCNRLYRLCSTVLFSFNLSTRTFGFTLLIFVQNRRDKHLCRTYLLVLRAGLYGAVIHFFVSKFWYRSKVTYFFIILHLFFPIRLSRKNTFKHIYLWFTI